MDVTKKQLFSICLYFPFFIFPHFHFPFNFVICGFFPFLVFLFLFGLFWVTLFFPFLLFFLVDKGFQTWSWNIQNFIILEKKSFCFFPLPYWKILPVFLYFRFSSLWIIFLSYHLLPYWWKSISLVASFTVSGCQFILFHIISFVIPRIPHKFIRFTIISYMFSGIMSYEVLYRFKFCI